MRMFDKCIVHNNMLALQIYLEYMIYIKTNDWYVLFVHFVKFVFLKHCRCKL